MNVLLASVESESWRQTDADGLGLHTKHCTDPMFWLPACVIKKWMHRLY